MELFLGNNLITRILFFGAVVFISIDFFVTVFTIFYQRYWYGRVFRPKFDNSFQPKCSIIVPCKGIPKDLGKNLEGFFELEYPDYEVIFVVESEQDAALPVIKSIIEKKSNAKVAIAGLATSCAQKNHNLLAALKFTDNPDVYVFADSDIRPDKQWLRELILPLSLKKVTVTSGFRWLHAKKGTIGELTHSYINAFMYVLFSAACFFGGVGLWGGSMAIRRKDFEAFKVAEKWSRASVDDMSLSQVVLKNSGKAVLVPPCVVQSDDLIQTVGSSISWFERQVMYFKTYQTPLYFLVIPLGILMFTLVFLMPFALLGAISENRTFFGLGGGAALLFYVGELITVSLYPFLGAMHRFPKFLILQPIMRTAHAIGIIKTSLTNTITWAGIKYNVNIRGEVVRIRRPDTD